MSHLSRRYLDYFYRKSGKGKKNGLVKVPYMKRSEFIESNPMIPIQGANAVFPCEHEERGFLSKKGRKTNRTHARCKRRNKARIKARKAA